MKIKNITLGLIFLLVFTGYASAFGVSAAYSAVHPVVLSPGDTIEIPIILQNMAGEKDLRATGVISQGEEIAELVNPEEIYEIPFMGKKELALKIKIPKDFEMSDTFYEIKIYFKIIPEEGAGTLMIGSGIEKKIPVLITDKEISMAPQSEFNWKLYSLIGAILIIIIIIIIILVKRKKNKTEYAQELRENNPTNFK